MITIDPQRRPLFSRIISIKTIAVAVLAVAAGVLLGSGSAFVKADRGSGSADAAQAPQAGSLLISEFRLRGAGGPTDEFIEVYNNTGASHTVSPTSGTGYGVVT